MVGNVIDRVKIKKNFPYSSRNELGCKKSTIV